jgi:hypothetical protein
MVFYTDSFGEKRYSNIWRGSGSKICIPINQATLKQPKTRSFQNSLFKHPNHSESYTSTVLASFTFLNPSHHKKIINGTIYSPQYFWDKIIMSYMPCSNTGINRESSTHRRFFFILYPSTPPAVAGLVQRLR